MLGILCLLSCLGAVFCGGIGLTEPFLQYHQLGAGAAARTSIAYGNNAFLARYAGLAAVPVAGAAVAAAPVAHAAVATPFAATLQGGYFAQPYAAHTAAVAPVAAISSPLVAARTAVAAEVAAVPVAHTGPLVASAPVISSVEHVPAVAQVPVTKYEAQPAVIQNVVDVANPKVATRKFEIRRPAIQKDFYDIEQRTVVRPAGSAVVELDQPISKNQRGPTVVSPAGQQLVAAAPVAHAFHTQGVLPAFPAVPIHSYPVQGPTLQQPVIPSVGVTPLPQQPIGPSTPRPELSDQPQFDDSDSVSVENPEFGRARIAQSQAQRQDTLQLQRFIDQSQELRAQQEFQSRARLQAQEQLAQQELQARARLQAQEQEFQARARQQAQEQLVQQELQARARLQAQEQLAQREFQARARQHAQEQLAQQEFQARARIQAQQQLIGQQQQFEHQQLQASLRSQQASQRQSIAPAPVRESVEISSRSGLGGLARTSVSEVASVRNLPEVELSNQARLIALLTERGPVSEVRSGDGLDGRVRARVLSATPAPLNAVPQDEKFSTRRVVVNRPIQTVQEVDVVEPFTKIERVAVQQPALIKTARLGVANVATSVPVQTYTHAHYAI